MLVHHDSDRRRQVETAHQRCRRQAERPWIFGIQNRIRQPGCFASEYEHVFFFELSIPNGSLCKSRQKKEASGSQLADQFLPIGGVPQFEVLPIV